MSYAVAESVGLARLDKGLDLETPLIEVGDAEVEKTSCKLTLALADEAKDLSAGKRWLSLPFELMTPLFCNLYTANCKLSLNFVAAKPAAADLSMQSDESKNEGGDADVELGVRCRCCSGTGVADSGATLWALKWCLYCVSVGVSGIKGTVCSRWALYGDLRGDLLFNEESRIGANATL